MQAEGNSKLLADHFLVEIGFRSEIGEVLLQIDGNGMWNEVGGAMLHPLSPALPGNSVVSRTDHACQAPTAMCPTGFRHACRPAR